MSARRRTTMFICGGDFTPDARSDCPNPLHNWPLARGYVDASEQAARRLRTGWANTRCPDCHLYGWRPGKLHEDDTMALPPTPDPKQDPEGRALVQAIHDRKARANDAAV